MTNDENPFFDEDSNGSEMTCWRDGARYCEDNCAAYEDRCAEDPRFSPCMLLNIRRAQARSFANIASELKRVNDRTDVANEEMRNVLVATNKHADKKRAAEAYAQKLKEMDPGPPEIR